MKALGSYEEMFGRPEVSQVDHVVPEILPMKLDEKLIRETMEFAKKTKQWVLAYVIGTKPCFYKFYGSIMESEKQKVPYIVINSGQHYDEVLAYGLKEFNIREKVAVSLAIRGDLGQKSGELLFKMGWLARYMKKNWPDVIVMPVVLGDTIMTAIVPAAWMFSRNEKAIQNEAGLRSMTPSIMRDAKKTDVEKFIDEQFHGKWELLRNEPFPEQWDTYVSAAGSEFWFCPVELNREHLIREGYNQKNMFVIGGVVVDALELKKKEKAEKSVFEIYPQLEKGQWLRVDIHRRENLTPVRFKNIVETIKALVEKGHNVNFIEMSATKKALDFYKLRPVMDKLKKHKNFLYTGVWPEYAHVIEFFQSDKCWSVLTDSGGVQEEMNLLHKVCLTCRLSTDRPETVKDAHSNLLVPPIGSDFMVKLIEHVSKNQDLQESMKNAKNIYGSAVGSKFVKIIKELMAKKERPFSWAHEALGLWKEKENSVEYL